MKILGLDPGVEDIIIPLPDRWLAAKLRVFVAKECAMNGLDEIVKIIDQISAEGSIDLASWPASAPFTPELLGLVKAPSGRLGWPATPQLLDVALLQDSYPELAVRYLPIIDSTNTALVKASATGSIANTLYLTEFQYGGRGRRGRTWLSPFARNLAVTLGFACARPVGDIGGLSLVVGLALAETLVSLGVDDVELKWPNDVLVRGCKVAGILIELVERDGAAEIVVGIGVNVHINQDERELIEQPVIDLAELGVMDTRTTLVGLVVQNVRRFVEHFEAEGFLPFKRAFDQRHALHGKDCTVIYGATRVTGTVNGVGEQGELVFDTKEGEKRFYGGEVSLRGKLR